MFDDSSQHGGPATIPLPQVVARLARGISLMPVGSKYRFWIPAALGLRRTGHARRPDPAERDLVFEVELLDVAKGGKPPMPQAR